MRRVPLLLLGACSFAGRGTIDGRTEDGTDSPATTDSDGSATTDAAACIQPPTGLLAWWPGDGDAAEVSGNFTGVLVGGARADATGVAGSAFGFDGIDDQITIATAPQSAAFTIEAWIDVVAGTNYRTLYAATPRGFWLLNGRMCWWQTTDRYQSTTAVPAGWHHVALTYDGAEFAGYIDGLPQGTTAFAGASLPASSVGIGGHDNEYITGRIDELSIYSRALTQAEISAIVVSSGAGKCRP